MNVEQWTSLVYRLARKYFKQNEGEIDDIVQDCLLHLVKVAPRYDASKSAEMTFVWMAVSAHLMSARRKQMRRRTLAKIVNAPVEVVEIGKPMDDDLQEVMQVVREATEDTSYRIRSVVRRTLHRKGWSMARIDESFSRISENLLSQGDRHAYIVSCSDE